MGNPGGVTPSGPKVSVKGPQAGLTLGLQKRSGSWWCDLRTKASFCGVPWFCYSCQTLLLYVCGEDVIEANKTFYLFGGRPWEKWVRRRVSAELVRLTRLWGWVSRGGRNCFILGLTSQTTRPWLVLRSWCRCSFSGPIAPCVPVEDFCLTMSPGDFVSCLSGVSWWLHYSIYLLLVLKQWASLWLTCMYPPKAVVREPSSL